MAFERAAHCCSSRAAPQPPGRSLAHQGALDASIGAVCADSEAAVALTATGTASGGSKAVAAAEAVAGTTAAAGGALASFLMEER